MASKTIQSSAVTFLDMTDSRRIEVHIASNLPTVQIHNSNTDVFTPDWTLTPLTLSPSVFIDSKEITTDTQTTYKWYRQVGTDAKTQVSTNRVHRISTNELADGVGIITYTCEVTYQGIIGSDVLTFSRVDTGKDGTGVNIKGTAANVTAVSGTDYYTITYGSGVVQTASVGDGYLYRGNLYICADSRDGVDYFINTGSIQGPAGEPAKQIIISADSQVFRVSNTGIVSPSTIRVSATPINTTITDWAYSTNGGATFLNTPPTGVTRSGNTVSIAGPDLTTNSLVIKASDGTYSDMLTIYKAYDGSDGKKGDIGQSASMVFLTNENITFSADKDGKIIGTNTSFSTNVVAFNGTTKVTPTIGTITGLPTGMTVNTSSAVVNNEKPIIFSFPVNATLGAATSNSGTITIPITSPVSTSLKLNWSKINTGANGRGVRTVEEFYAITEINTVAPTTWSTTPVSMTKEKPYLWNYEKITYTDNGVDNTTPVVIGIYSGDGRGITSVVNHYLVSGATSGITRNTLGWTTTVQTMTDTNKYLWNYEQINYTDGDPDYTDPVIIGAYGDKGLKGDSGTPASLVNITPTALYFKSTTGKDGIFTPDYIYLYPTFQTVTYSNWQYSVNGGQTWSGVSGANGLSVGTYNSVANTLRVARGSTLYTDTVTSISFRCNSNNVAIYDIVSIAKIYDVVDLQIGGRNLFRNSKNMTTTKFWATNSSHAISIEDECIKGKVSIKHEWTYLEPDTDYTITALVKFDSAIEVPISGNQVPVHIHVLCNENTDLNNFQPIKQVRQDAYQQNQFQLYTYTFKTKSNITNARMRFMIYETSVLHKNEVTIWVKQVKVEKGKNSTDWTPAVEDMIEESSSTTVMLSNESHLFEADSNGIPTEESIMLDVIGFKGATQTAATVGTISGVPTGMTTSIANNGTTSTKINIAIDGTLTSVDSGVLTIPITVNEKIINKKFSWAKSKAGAAGASGVDAVTFQVYSENGFALSINNPSLTLKTFAYVGDVQITAGASYKWYSYSDGVWSEISNQANPYLIVNRDDVAFSSSYMCKMIFNGVEYTGVVTVEDKNDVNKIFSIKPINYAAGDFWIVGADYIPPDVEVGTLLKAEHTNISYSDDDWVNATKYDDKLTDIKKDVDKYNQAFNFDQATGITISAVDANGNKSDFSTSISNTQLSFNEGDTVVASISGNKMRIREAEIESPLTIAGRYSGSTLLQAPTLNIGAFSIVVESNGSLSIIANT